MEVLNTTKKLNNTLIETTVCSDINKHNFTQNIVKKTH